jgi:hypothetical protein
MTILLLVAAVVAINAAIASAWIGSPKRFFSRIAGDLVMRQAAASKGFAQPKGPKVIVPTPGNAKNEKFMMMYTCKLCNGRNAQMVSRLSARPNAH